MRIRNYIGIILIGLVLTSSVIAVNGPLFLLPTPRLIELLYLSHDQNIKQVYLLIKELEKRLRDDTEVRSRELASQLQELLKFRDEDPIEVSSRAGYLDKHDELVEIPNIKLYLDQVYYTKRSVLQLLNHHVTTSTPEVRKRLNFLFDTIESKPEDTSATLKSLLEELGDTGDIKLDEDVTLRRLVKSLALLDYPHDVCRFVRNTHYRLWKSWPKVKDYVNQFLPIASQRCLTHIRRQLFREQGLAHEQVQQLIDEFDLLLQSEAPSLSNSDEMSLVVRLLSEMRHIEAGSDSESDSDSEFKNKFPRGYSLDPIEGPTLRLKLYIELLTQLGCTSCNMRQYLEYLQSEQTKVLKANYERKLHRSLPYDLKSELQIIAPKKALEGKLSEVYDVEIIEPVINRVFDVTKKPPKSLFKKRVVTSDYYIESYKKTISNSCSQLNRFVKNRISTYSSGLRKHNIPNINIVHPLDDYCKRLLDLEPVIEGKIRDMSEKKI